MKLERLRILVVDDNQDFCGNVKDILETEGWEVLTAYSGQSAVELAQKERLDLILVDLVMPGMDGVTVIKTIRKLFPSLAIAVVTAFGEETLLQDALVSGANSKFEKPIDFDRLFTYIQTHCTR
ncbi:MAG: response regulator [Chloroflexi bacterium]|nr:response regulator [Chloroflexota bacterium]